MGQNFSGPPNLNNFDQNNSNQAPQGNVKTGSGHQFDSQISQSKKIETEPEKIYLSDAINVGLKNLNQN